MPINFEWDRDLEEWDWSTVSGGLDSLEVPSEEFWKKFEELPDLGDNLETLFAEVSDLDNCGPLGGEMLRNHDCMWAGVCLSKDHNKDCQPESPPPLAAPPPFQSAILSPGSSPVMKQQSREIKRTVIVQKTRSLLLSNRSAEVVIRPDTPQSMGSESEEEPVSARAALPASEVTGQVRRKCPPAVTVEFDHDYEAKKVVRTDDLGVVTPSDSEEEEEEQEEEQEVEEEEVEEEEEEEEAEEEDDDEDDEDEEIDVVSLSSTRSNPLKASSRCTSPRTPSSRGMVYNGYGYVTPKSHQALPTNPTTQVRNQLQETVADSLLTASRAVSRRLQGSVKRKRCASFRSPASTPATPGPGRGRRRVTPAKKSRISGHGYNMVDTEKRSLHNNMERMRRIDLRNAFEDLRLLVPSISDSQKAAKVTILKDATHYVKELNLKDRNLSVQLEALRTEQDRLRRTLSHLRRILVSKNIAN